MAAGKAYFPPRRCVSHSPDHGLVAYTADEKGSEFFSPLRDPETGPDLTDEMPDTEGAPVWANDGRTPFYSARRCAPLPGEGVPPSRG